MRKITSLSLSLSLSLCNKHAESYWRVLLLILFLSFHFVSCKKAEDPIPSTNASIQNLTLKLEDKEYPIVFDDKNNAVLTFPAGTKLPPTVTIQQITIAPKASTTVKQNDQLPIIDNQITLSITAEDGMTNSKYTITFFVKLSTGAEIKTLTLKVNENTYTPDFNERTNVVIALVPGEDIPNEVTVTSLSLSENAKASVKQNDKLEIKNDQATIKITSEDKKKTNAYTLTFIIQKLVSFNTDGGSVIPAKAVPIGQMTTAPKPTKEGFYFDGWYTDEMTTMAFDFNTPIEQDMTLYAKWSPFTINLKQGTIKSTIVSYDIKVSVEGKELIKLEKQTVPQGNSPLDLSKTLPLPSDTEALVAIDAYNANDHRVGSASQTIDTSTGANFDISLISRGICFILTVDYSDVAMHILSLPEEQQEDWNEYLPIEMSTDRIDDYGVFDRINRVEEPDATTIANGPWTSTTYVSDLKCGNYLKGREIRVSANDITLTKTHEAFSGVIDPPNEDVVEYFIELKWQGPF